MQSVCHGNMCILLLVKLIQCTGFSEIYAQLVAKVGGSVCHGYKCILLYMKLFKVVVLQRSMLNWRKGGSVCHGYMCMLLYVKPI